MVKVCTKCNVEKPLDEFKDAKQCKGGKHTQCRKCTNAASRDSAIKNRAASLAAKKRWRDNNKDHQNKLCRAWEAANRDRARETCRKSYWKNADARREYQRNRIKDTMPERLENNARRKSAKLKSTPKWANEFYMREIYSLANRRSKATGTSWHVDHIVPLRCKLVCGLHNEFNLQLLPARENIAKGNRHWPDMP